MNWRNTGEKGLLFKSPITNTVLAAAGVSDIYLCGMMTQNCITHTALSPDAAAWRVHIIADACTAPDARIHAVAARALSARLDVVSAVGFQAALGVV